MKTIKTTHELGRALLEGPDLRVAVLARGPGADHVVLYPALLDRTTVEGIECILIIPAMPSVLAPPDVLAP